MDSRIVIVGAGTGGTLVANRLARALGEDVQIIVLDRDDRHVYQPGLLHLPFGLAREDEIVRSRREQLAETVELRLVEIDHVDSAASTVHLDDGATVEYDVLLIASGARLLPEDTDGLTGPGWGETMFSFYTLEDAVALREALRSLDRGRLVVNVIDMPIKCPVAPLEFCFLADWHLRRRGVRSNVEITFVTPLDGAFTKPVAAEHLAGLLAAKEIRLESEFATGSVDGPAGRLTSWDEREVPFDLLVAVPLHGGAEFVGRSPGLGDELDFVRTDPHTLQSRVAPNVFAIGDAASLPTSKAGSAVHYESDTVTTNIKRFLAGDEPLRGYGGHVNCFVETGFAKALMIDFDYDSEPLPGRYPDAHLGPFPLLRESRLNHFAKLAFQPLYWHVLLPGHGLPGFDGRAPASAGQPVPTTQGGTS